MEIPNDRWWYDPPEDDDDWDKDEWFDEADMEHDEGGDYDE